MIKYLYNTSAVETIRYLGIPVLPESFCQIPDTLLDKSRKDDVLTDLINDDKLLMSKDGIVTLNKADSLIFQCYYAEGLDQRFRPDSERDNEFTSENVQDAIEEARFSGSLPFEYNYDESEAESQTTSSSYQQKLRLTVSLNGGDYRIGWFCEMNGSNGSSKVVGMRVQVDDTTTLNESTASDLRNNWQSLSGFKKVALTSGSHDIDLDYKKISTKAKIKRARLEIWRVE